MPELEIKLRELRGLWAAIWQVDNAANAAAVDCSEWKNPLPVTSDTPLATGDNAAARWYNAIVAKGGELWWPTPEEAIAAADRHTEALARGEQQRRADFINLNRALDAGFAR